MSTRLLWWIVWISVLAGTASAQKVELTAFVGGQTNGGLELSTSLFQRIDVQNGMNYGLSAGYLLGEHGSIEFMWNYNKADTVAEPRAGSSNKTVFTLDTNQYFGNFLYHFSPREQKLRPFVLLGLGATSLHAARNDVSGITRFAWALGEELNTTSTGGWSAPPGEMVTHVPHYHQRGFWCDPFWGGCWAVGDSHFLNEFDATVGLTLRF
jgi:hypothetical protein